MNYKLEVDPKKLWKNNKFYYVVGRDNTGRINTHILGYKNKRYVSSLYYEQALYDFIWKLYFKGVIANYHRDYILKHYGIYQN